MSRVDLDDINVPKVISILRNINRVVSIAVIILGTVNIIRSIF